jgi:hypothetical protein
MWKWLKSLFAGPQYKVCVSFNTQWGDADDKEFITKKIMVQKENYLKFRTIEGKMVEFRASAGLNYRVEEV